MKIDIDLCRKILIYIEKQYTEIENLEIDGYSMEEVAFHCKILKEANLILNYSEIYAEDHIDHFCVSGLTLKGNEFLNKIRQDNIWNKIKNKMKQEGLTLVLDIIKIIDIISNLNLK